MGALMVTCPIADSLHAHALPFLRTRSHMVEVPYELGSDYLLSHHNEGQHCYESFPDGHRRDPNRAAETLP